MSRRTVFLIVFVGSIGAATFFFLRSPEDTIRFSGMIMGMMSAFGSLYAAFAKDVKPEPQPRKKKGKPDHFRLAPSLKSAFFGGLIGGGAAGLLNGLMYYAAFRHTRDDVDPAGWDSIVFIFVYAVVTGGIFGLFYDFFAQVFRYALNNALVGCLVGGVVGGSLAGAVMGLWAGVAFGSINKMSPNQFVVFGGGILCGICVVLGTLLYSRRDAESIKRSMLIMAPVTLVIGSIGVTILLLAFKTDFTGNYTVIVLHAALFGAVVSSLWGLLLGLTEGLTNVILPHKN